MTEMPDLAQAAYLELAVMALERRDLPALVGALASLKADTLDQLAAVTAHPAWAVLADLIPVAASGGEK